MAIVKDWSRNGKKPQRILRESPTWQQLIWTNTVPWGRPTALGDSQLSRFSASINPAPRITKERVQQMRSHSTPCKLSNRWCKIGLMVAARDHQDRLQEDLLHLQTTW